MSMTRQHFQRFAEMIQSMDYLYPVDKVGVAADLAAVFSEYNPHFDDERFYKACGFDESVIKEMV